MATRRKRGRPVCIIDGSRTPFLKAQGRPGPFRASDLAVGAARPLLERLPLDPGKVDEVILGCVMPGPEEVNIARVVALRLGFPQEIPAWTVQRNCGSGMQALDAAVTRIREGRAGLVLAGGTEAMSHAPVLWNTAFAAWLGEWSRARSPMARVAALGRLRLEMFKPVIGLLKGLTDPLVGLSMGQTAEELAWRFRISREEMDRFAQQSHHRIARAHDDGLLAEEVEPLYDTRGRTWLEDTGVRRDTTLERLAKLRPVFDRPFGLVTAGNSAQVSDGAAWLLLADPEVAEREGLPVLAEIIDSQWAGLDPAQMGLGPVHAMTPIMERNRLSIDRVDFWEINEAFAAQVLACLAAWADEAWCREHLGRKKAMGTIPRERLNVNGGAISIGHPVGASGARIVLHLARLLQRERASLGMASLCIGGGQGGAMLIRRTDNGESNQ